MFDTPQQKTYFCKQAMFMEVNGYLPVYNRSFNINANDRRVVDELANATQDWSNITSASIASVSSKLILPSTTVGEEVFIENGLGDYRFVFMIAIEEHDTVAMSSLPKVVVISGYTDRVDTTYNGIFAPDTKLFINQVISVNQAVRNYSRITSVDHLYNGGTYDAYGHSNFKRNAYTDTLINTLRPEDVICEMELTDRAQSTNAVVFNTTSSVKPNTQTRARRQDTLASRYISNIVGSLVYDGNMDLNSNDYGWNSNQFSGRSIDYNGARSRVRSRRTTSDSLIHRLSTYTEFGTGGYIQFCDLEYEVPNIAGDNTTILRRDKLQTTRKYNPDDSNEWYGADNATLMATIIAQSLPAIMASNLVTYLNISFTNRTTTGEFIVTLNNSTSSNDIGIATFGDYIDPIKQYRNMESVIITELIPMIMFDETMELEISVETDLLVESLIYISIDGGPYEQFVMPMFCDALVSPLVTTDRRVLNNVTQSLRGLADEAIGAKRVI